MAALLALLQLNPETLRITAVCLAVAFLVIQYFRTRFRQRRPQNQLANTTILIIRHSEKPTSGRVLNQQGRTRAHAYAHYFAPFQHAAQSFTIDTLIAGADSKRSIRPHLTLEPLSRATGIPIDASHSTNDTPALAKFLRKSNRGKAILICWRHNQIPILLTALGADISQLLPESKWPAGTYDWVILLRYEARGELTLQQRIHQPELTLTNTEIL